MVRVYAVAHVAAFYLEQYRSPAPTSVALRRWASFLNYARKAGR